MQYEPENEAIYFGHQNYGNLQFNHRNKLLFYSIKNGVLDKVTTKWKFSYKKNKLIINYNKKTIYVYDIIKQETIKIPLENKEETPKAPTIILTLIKIKSIPSNNNHCN